MAVTVPDAEVANLGVNFFSYYTMRKTRRSYKGGDNVSNCKTWAKNNKLSYAVDRHCAQMSDRIIFADPPSNFMLGLSKPSPNKYKDGSEFKTTDWRKVIQEIEAEEQQKIQEIKEAEQKKIEENKTRKRQQELSLLPQCNKYNTQTGTNVFKTKKFLYTHKSNYPVTEDITTDKCNPTNLPDCDSWSRLIKNISTPSNANGNANENANGNVNRNGWVLRKKNLDGSYSQCNEAKLPMDTDVRERLMKNYRTTMSDNEANIDANKNRQIYPLVKTPRNYIIDRETQIGGRRKSRR
jgi:hypothetical protein